VIESGGRLDLPEYFGRIDIYVFDQLLRGNVDIQRPVLDAGCGSGRNSLYLLRRGADVHGIDRDDAQVGRLRERALEVRPNLPGENFSTGSLDQIDYPDGFFGTVLCNAVLHFSEDEAYFEAAVSEMWRVLAPGGLFFARLASTIGLEGAVERTSGRWHRLPDGSDRFLVDEGLLSATEARLGAVRVDPLKTTIVEGMRSMTTWVLRKQGFARVD
jgi:SAM-dependent methyltransferase